MTRLLLAIVVLFCGLAAGAQAAPPATLTPGTLTVGLNMPSEGFQTGIVDGSRVVYAQGLEIDLARELSRRLELTDTTFLQSPFADLLAAGDKPWDVALAEVSITKRRAKRVDFSAWYLRVDQAVLLSQYIERTPTSIAGLRGLHLCAQKGTTGADTIRRRIKPTSKPLLIEDVSDMMFDLQVGRCDAVVFDFPALATLKARAPRSYGPLAGAIPTRERYGVVLPHGSPLRKQVSEAVRTMRADGTLARLVKTWLKVRTARIPVLR
jgi:polar amino acid transport system substrate-binding protein